jgi:hypothetical protein
MAPIVVTAVEKRQVQDDLRPVNIAFSLQPFFQHLGAVFSPEH